MLKRLALLTIGCTILTTVVRAEPQFPDWDKICPADQRSWGFEVRRGGSASGPWLSLKIPAKLAPFFTQADVMLKHHSKPNWVRMHAGFEVAPDGSKLLEIYVYDAFFDDMSVVIVIDFTSPDPTFWHRLAALANTSPRVGRCEDGKVAERFAGFTFIIPSPR